MMRAFGLRQTTISYRRLGGVQLGNHNGPCVRVAVAGALEFEMSSVFGARALGSSLCVCVCVEVPFF